MHPFSYNSHYAGRESRLRDLEVDLGHWNLKSNTDSLWTTQILNIKMSNLNYLHNLSELHDEKNYWSKNLPRKIINFTLTLREQTYRLIYNRTWAEAKTKAVEKSKPQPPRIHNNNKTNANLPRNPRCLLHGVQLNNLSMESLKADGRSIATILSTNETS